MQQGIQQVKNHLLSLIVLMVAAVLTGCSSKENPYVFKSAKDAVKCCHSKLSELTAKKDASISDLIKIVNDYAELKDSCYSIFLKDTTFDYRGELAVEYVGVSDSIQSRIIEITKARPRSMEDIVDLKIGTAAQREKLQGSKNYKEVEKFFMGLDENKEFKDTRSTIVAYLDLLKNDIATDEKSITSFLAREDQCFRSLLKHFPDIPEDIVQAITENTVTVFNNLEDSLLVKKKMSSIEDKTMIYMTMRLNRRIIQNAMSCKDQIKQHRQLNKYTSSNYRWMLMQPFIAIDQTSMAVMTENQIKDMKEIARELPMLLMELDGGDTKKLSKEESEKITGILCDFFLNSYIKMIL